MIAITIEMRTQMMISTCIQIQNRGIFIQLL
jgi:hypothetical protein